MPALFRAGIFIIIFKNHSNMKHLPILRQILALLDFLYHAFIQSYDNGKKGDLK